MSIFADTSMGRKAKNQATACPDNAPLSRWIIPSKIWPSGLEDSVTVRHLRLNAIRGLSSNPNPLTRDGALNKVQVRGRLDLTRVWDISPGLRSNLKVAHLIIATADLGSCCVERRGWAHVNEASDTCRLYPRR
jgi:hypothetical protein